MTTETKTANTNLTDDLLQIQKPMYSSLTVAILQQLLVLEGYGTLPDGTTLPVTGNFLDETVTAVENFQRAMGLSVDGIVGANTWAALLPNY
ncbi:peptidoglycan-binding protein [Nostoc sp. FACHB-152]|uniref:peptidoglycan-binding domain-containing protein n=1 Tax=unclassified Nostoc TaxID=2593658 RepID=UPI001686AE2D|nr:MULTISPECIES: peptidoglycan-binding domain-containing protein [unclassified Nostoc]MBD2451953.1 peptidoglycan-binding protein [Nostoc sp. FACHB-152]MBD2473045.1 peptidoglycan-binding protein [Nostoc sp. FACHB-145]